MSVIVFLVAVADAAADSLLADPQGFQRFMLGGELTFDGPEERAAYYRDGVLPKALRTAVRPASVDMDKAWAAIHHIISRYDNPLLGFIERGGRDIRLPNKRKGRFKAGDLLARVFSSLQVSELHTALQAIDDASFTSGFDPHALTAAHIYPEVWDEYGLDYVLPWFQGLKAFIAERVEQNQGILVGVS